MDVDLITEDAVRQALECVRFARSLAGNPLLGTKLVCARLAAEGLADSGTGREMALAATLSRTIEERLATARVACAEPAAVPGRSPGGSARRIPMSRPALRLLEADYLADDPRREAWSALFYRYLAVPPLQVKDVATVVRSGSPYGRTHVARRIGLGIQLLSLALRDLEAAERWVDTSPGGGGPQRVGGEARAALLAAVRSEDRAVSLPLPQVQQVLASRPLDLTEYRLARIAEWSQPRYLLDGRFVALTLLVDQGEEVMGDRWVAKEERYDDLGTLLANVPDPAVVVIGPPGSGKSTLLRHLDLDTAIAAMRGDDARDPVTFFIQLNQYKALEPAQPVPSPERWLASRWADRYLGDGRVAALHGGAPVGAGRHRSGAGLGRRPRAIVGGGPGRGGGAAWRRRGLRVLEGRDGDGVGARGWGWAPNDPHRASGQVRDVAGRRRRCR